MALQNADDDCFHTPLTPPTTEEDIAVWLRLIRSRRVGPATFWRLIREYVSAERALEALPEIARAAGADNYSVCPMGVAVAELRAGTRAGAKLVRPGDAGFPPDLGSVDACPPLLWVMGDPDTAQRPAIAIVGARSASSLGMRMARRLAQDLGAEGYVIISGLARGIDAAAHEAALVTGTIAVQAGGINVIYPQENTELAVNIGRTGLRISEMPVGAAPQARHFPQRNRLIAGACQAVVVVEAATGSGTLITARDALDLGRDVLAVPGHPVDPRAAGCNQLIRDGATLVRSAADILE
ncbi:MAG TPA: DNA-processing protein DprA, partial [Paenirhodobacter sp.]